VLDKRDRLGDLEEVIERGLTTFVEVGNAIREIRDSKLYKEAHDTFEAYCLERWGWSRAKGYQMIEAATTVQAMSTVVDTPIPNERVARELTPLKGDPETMNRVWVAVVEEARQTGQDVTAEKVRAKVEEQKKPPVPWSEEERGLLERLRGGETVVLNMHADGHQNLVAWAKDRGLFTRIDRASEWGNPFEVGKDGNREAVVENYDLYYLPHKPSLLKKLPSLKGKALGCWCAPQRCHGNALRERSYGGAPAATSTNAALVTGMEGVAGW
jgi:hypothetical protein